MLVAVHLALFAHILHWRLAGETLSPLEPSEAMFTVARGMINAGFLLLCLTVLSTLVLGRWFCGWACHLVALQDGASWILGKLGMRPRPLRSRWLVFVPLGAALWMFAINPIGSRLAAGEEAPSAQLALTKQHFWETFPGLALAALTFFVCGFVIVWLLGSKGFCTYACPYGGLFGVADRLAPGRIRVTDACKGCGHCTASCTSNVIVHKEVLQYGMVVDPGCMKCGDCIAACPEKALYFGFGRPALFAKAKRKLKRAPSGLLGYGEEVLALAVFLLSYFIYNGIPEWWTADLDKLYGRMPLLLALACSALTAFSAVLLVRWVRSRELELQGRVVKRAGRPTRAGLGLGLALFAILGLTAHSGVVQYHVLVGTRAYDETQIGELAWKQDEASLAARSPATLEAAQRARRHLERARAIGLAPDIRLPSKLAWLALVRGDTAGAEALYQQVLELAPTHVPTLLDLARLRFVRDDAAGAAEVLETLVRLVPDNPAYRERLASAYYVEGRVNEALTLIESAAALAPDSAFIQLRAAAMRAGASHDPARAVEGARRAAQLAPDDARLLELAAQLLAAAGERADADALRRRAASLQADALAPPYAAE